VTLTVGTVEFFSGPSRGERVFSRLPRIEPGLCSLGHSGRPSGQSWAWSILRPEGPSKNSRALAGVNFSSGHRPEGAAANGGNYPVKFDIETGLLREGERTREPMSSPRKTPGRRGWVLYWHL
jgi:hypothetical protein